jgi:hypothetical protein
MLTIGSAIDVVCSVCWSHTCRHIDLLLFPSLLTCSQTAALFDSEGRHLAADALLSSRSSAETATTLARGVGGQRQWYPRGLSQVVLVYGKSLDG